MKGSLSPVFNVVNDNKKEGADDWNIPAGVDGKQLARPAVTVRSLGTVSLFKQNSSLSAQDAAKAEAVMKKLEAANAQALAEAVAILSQSRTGREILKDAMAAGYNIVFDDRRTRQLKAGGLCDPVNKLIVLKSGADPQYIALVLAHEATHAAQHSRKGIYPSSRHRPDAGILLTFASEADAYAHQVQVALELAHGDPAGPASQMRFSGPIAHMRQRFPDIVTAAEEVYQKDPQVALTNSAALTAAFRAFYDNQWLRSYYEENYANWVQKAGPEILKGPMRDTSFRDGVRPAEVAARLLHHGKPYLEQHGADIDLGSEKFSGVTKRTAQRFREFYAAAMPGIDPPDFRIFGKFLSRSAAKVFAPAQTGHEPPPPSGAIRPPAPPKAA